MRYRWLVVSLLLLSAQVARAGDCQLQVAVASSFRPAFEKLLPEFESASACNVRITSGGSGMLYQQIVHGARYDVFLSADRQRPMLLEQGGKVVPGSRNSYARGLLALWLPDTTRGGAAVLRQWQENIVLADSKVAPFGIAARQTLQSLNLADEKQSQLVQAHNAGQAFMLLQAGHAQVGFVAASQMVAAGRKNFWLVPQEFYAPIDQQMVILRQGRSPEMAKELAGFLLSAATRQRLLAMGYGLAAEKGR